MHLFFKLRLNKLSEIQSPHVSMYHLLSFTPPSPLPGLLLLPDEIMCPLEFTMSKISTQCTVRNAYRATEASHCSGS